MVTGLSSVTGNVTMQRILMVTHLGDAIVTPLAASLWSPEWGLSLLILIPMHTTKFIKMFHSMNTLIFKVKIV